MAPSPYDAKSIRSSVGLERVIRERPLHSSQATVGWCYYGSTPYWNNKGIAFDENPQFS
jgi:hypothetical protein